MTDRLRPIVSNVFYFPNHFNYYLVIFEYSICSIDWNNEIVRSIAGC